MSEKSLKPSDIAFDDEALIVDGIRFPCERPRLTFAKALGAFLPADCTAKQGSVVGGDGFGFERDENGIPVRIPHLGGVKIGDDVEIGTCTVICRGTVNDTIIGNHVKLDDHVFIAHNVQIGDCTLVVAGAVICGSAKIGKRCWIGAGATIKEGIAVGDDAVVGMGAVVLRDVSPNTVVVGNPARFLRRVDE